MKYFFTTLAAIIFFTFAVHTTVFALDLGSKTLTQNAATQAGFDPDTDDTRLAEIIGTVIRAVLSLAGVIFTFLIAYAGDLWMTARGDEGKIEKAQSIIVGSIIGLVISLAAYTISNFAVSAVLDRATGQGETIQAGP